MYKYISEKKMWCTSKTGEDTLITNDKDKKASFHAKVIYNSYIFNVLILD